jgi:hypothetical protein
MDGNPATGTTEREKPTLLETKAQKSARREKMSDLIADANLIGKMITVVKSGYGSERGILEFHYNIRGRENTGYYFKGTQIPLVSIDEVRKEGLIIN